MGAGGTAPGPPFFARRTGGKSLILWTALIITRRTMASNFFFIPARGSMHSLLPPFKYVDKSSIGLFISDSRWLFPAIEAVHIVALALLFGAILMLNLRLFGLKVIDKPVARLAHDLAPWVFCSLMIILTSGVLLFSSEAL